MPDTRFHGIDLGPGLIVALIIAVPVLAWLVLHGEPDLLDAVIGWIDRH